MRKTELPNCPKWLLEAGTINENVEWDSHEQNHIIWKYGVWKYGAWKDGIWEYGIWEDGTWEDGIWKYGTWKGGTWKYGTWKGGTWGCGFWKGGTWEGGIWKGGIWEGGYKYIGSCKWRVYYNHIKEMVKIGCVEKSLKDWDRWFASDEVHETERNTEQFRRIEMAYELAKKAIELELKEMEG